MKPRRLWLLGAIVFPSIFLHSIELKFDKQFKMPHQIIVDGGFLEVHVEGEKRDDVQIMGSLEEVGTESSYEWKAEEMGKDLTIRLIAQKSPSHAVDGKLILKVPLQAQLKVINSSGDIWVSYLESQENSLKSASGKITLLNCQGTFKVSATSGEIKASHIMGKIRLYTLSGDQHLHMIKGDVLSRTTSGQIEAIDLKGDINIESNGGEIDLVDIFGNLWLETQSGKVKIAGLGVEKHAKIRSITGHLQVQIEDPLDCFTLRLTSQGEGIRLNGKHIGRKWRQLGPKKTLKLATVSGSIELNSKV